MRATDNLITQPAFRKARQQEKQDLVLRFLRQHLWSSQLILQSVLGLASRQATHKSLKQMAELGLVKSHVYQALGGDITLWGITANGQAMAFNIEHEQIVKAYFEPSKISEQNIRHQLDLQKLRVVAEMNSWTDWQDGDRLGNLYKNAKRPDAIAQDRTGLKVAIECERSFKSIKRYEQILLNYLKLIKTGDVASVIWVCPTNDFAIRLEILIKSIKSLKVAGQTIQIEREKHHKNIYFCSYAKWPNYE